jgi:phage tail sheath gpL-like
MQQPARAVVSVANSLRRSGEVDPSMAGLPVIYQPSLIVGTMIAPTLHVSVAAIAAGGTGYVVGDTISLDHGVHLQVLTITAGAVATVSVTGPGGISAAVAPPANPVPQFSTSGFGSGATFNLTWVPTAISANPGDALPNVPIAIGTQSQADAHFGVGSEVARMYRTFFANNFANETWGLGIPEPPNAQAATGTITITQQQTEAGTIHLYIAGTHVPVNIAASDTTDEVAAEIAEQINSLGEVLPVTATAQNVSCILTCTWKGVNGNDIRVDMNYYGTIGGEVTPIGLGITLPGPTSGTGTGTSSGTTSLTIAGATGMISTGAAVTGVGVPANTTIVSQTSGTPGGNGVYVTSAVTTLASVALTFQTSGVANFLHGGVGVPIMDTAIANLGEKQFEYVALPYTDSTTLNAWELEYGFEDVGRWGWRRQLYGHLFSARRDTYPNLLTFGNTRNSGVTSVMGVEMTSPSAVFDWVAAYVAKAQRALTNDPARPLQTLSLNTVKLAPLQDRFDTIEINSLATNGVATQKAGSDNQPMISRETTTYQLNLYGFRDDAYELVTTLATLARLIRNQRYAITSKYPRVKLADDGTRFGPGQAIVTPGIIKGELIAEYVQDMWDGLVENLQAFKANLLVERDPNDPNRINVLYGPDLINQLRIFAVLAQFRLQYDRGLDTAILGPNPATIGVTGVLPPLQAL